MRGQADVPVQCIPSADDFLAGAWHDRFDRSEAASTDAEFVDVASWRSTMNGLVRGEGCCKKFCFEPS
jgi:hypothetical protein